MKKTVFIILCVALLGLSGYVSCETVKPESTVAPVIDAGDDADIEIKSNQESEQTVNSTALLLGQKIIDKLYSLVLIVAFGYMILRGIAKGKLSIFGDGR